MGMYREEIESYLSLVIQTIKSLDCEELNRAMQAMEAAFEKEAAVYIFGNGGSAATASHFVCDFNKGASDGKWKKFRMICLNDNVPILTAIANDISYNDIFIHQLEGVLQKKDMVIAISGSGNSENVVRAAQYAKKVGATLIGMTGYTGGRLKRLADVSLHVPLDNMQVTEDIHMMFDHLMMSIFSKRLKNRDVQ